MKMNDSSNTQAHDSKGLDCDQTPRSFRPFPKPVRTVRKQRIQAERLAKKRAEVEEKRKVRARDGHRCRFPLCGCHKYQLALEVAHLHHKGMGSKDGVSTADQMILVCEHRHQHGQISLHKGTLRVVPLTDKGCDGPVRWESRLATTEEWGILAIEATPSDCFSADLHALKFLSEMVY